MTFTRLQTAFNHLEIPFQIDKREVRVTVAQQVAVGFFQRRADDQGDFVGTLHSERGVIQRLQPRFAVVVVQRLAGGHFHDVAARMEEVAIKERSLELMRHFAGYG